MSYTTPEGVPGYPGMAFTRGIHKGLQFKMSQLLQTARNAGFDSIYEYLDFINEGMDYSLGNSATTVSPPQSSSSSAATVAPPQSSSSSAATMSPPQSSSSSASSSSTAAPSMYVGGPPGITHPSLKKKGVSPFLPGSAGLYGNAFHSSTKGGRKTKRRKHKKATRRRR
jgi:hypothetical protein